MEISRTSPLRRGSEEVRSLTVVSEQNATEDLPTSRNGGSNFDKESHLWKSYLVSADQPQSGLIVLKVGDESDDDS